MKYKEFNGYNGSNDYFLIQWNDEPKQIWERFPNGDHRRIYYSNRPEVDNTIYPAIGMHTFRPKHDKLFKKTVTKLSKEELFLELL